MASILIVGPKSPVKDEFVRKLSIRLDWHKFSDSLEQTLHLRVDCLVDQQNGILKILPPQSFAFHEKPLLVVFIAPSRESIETAYVNIDWVEEDAVFAYCAFTTIPLRILSADEAVNPTVIDELVQNIEVLNAEVEKQYGLEQTYV